MPRGLELDRQKNPLGTILGVAAAVSLVVGLFNVPALLLLGLVLLIGALIAGIVEDQAHKAWASTLTTAATMGVTTMLPMDNAQQQILTVITARGGFPHGMMPGSISGMMTVKKRPSVVVTVLLWALCWIFGIIYMMTGSKDESTPFSVRLSPAAGGGTFVQGAGQGGALLVVAQAILSLPDVSVPYAR